MSAEEAIASNKSRMAKKRVLIDSLNKDLSNAKSEAKIERQEKIQEKQRADQERQEKLQEKQRADQLELQVAKLRQLLAEQAASTRVPKRKSSEIS